MTLPWYQWVAVIAASLTIISLIVGAIRWLFNAFVRKKPQHDPPTVSQRGKLNFNQTINVNNAKGDSKVGVDTKIGRKK